MYKLFTYNINYNISNKNYLKNFHFLIKIFKYNFKIYLFIYFEN